jgi:hypothetical protein
MIRRLLILTLIIFLGACARIHPINNIESSPVITGSGKTPSADQVRVAIVYAAVGKSWTVKTIGPNRLEAHVNVRKHAATITIDYSPQSYSIKYKDSQNLRQKGSMIHRTYNRWIKGLVLRINQRLVLL